MDRIIDLSSDGAFLSIKNRQLVIKTDTDEHLVPVDEVACIIASHPRVVCTQSVLQGICETGGSLIICNERRLPIGALLPLTGNYVQSRRMAEQAEASHPLKKQLWKQVISHKLANQADLLRKLIGSDYGIADMIRRIQSGDSTNIEARAARRHWRGLFGNKFRRIPGGTDYCNSVLNYGYAVVRGYVARAVAATGLHPAMGIHHHNKYNPFCLADDLMEPFRVVVDQRVWQLMREETKEEELGPIGKRLIVGGILNAAFRMSNRVRDLGNTALVYAQALGQVFAGERKKLPRPEYLSDDTED